MIVETTEFASPLGKITLATHEGRLCALCFTEGFTRTRRALERRFGAVEVRPMDGTADVVRQLRRYFDGDIAALGGIAVDPGGTVFQRKVWAALRRVPPGKTVSYRDLARSIGSPAAARAVGAANDANPIGIVIPCHRAIGADGRLVGYAWGVNRKEWLLNHERQAP